MLVDGARAFQASGAALAEAFALHYLRPAALRHPSVRRKKGDERLHCLSRPVSSSFAGQTIDTIGNSGRNNLYGPPQRRIDMSLFKDVAVGAARLQLRVECFNVTNTPSFSVPDGALGSSTFGRITSTANNIPRQFQFAAKYLF